MKKQIFAFAAIISIAASSCSKGDNTYLQSKQSDYVCRCDYKWYGKDTMTTYSYPNAIGQDSANNKCASQQKIVESWVGKGYGSCRIE